MQRGRNLDAEKEGGAEANAVQKKLCLLQSRPLRSCLISTQLFVRPISLIVAFLLTLQETCDKTYFPEHCSVSSSNARAPDFDSDIPATPGSVASGPTTDCRHNSCLPNALVAGLSWIKWLSAVFLKDHSYPVLTLSLSLLPLTLHIFLSEERQLGQSRPTQHHLHPPASSPY